MKQHTYRTRTIKPSDKPIVYTRTKRKSEHDWSENKVAWFFLIFSILLALIGTVILSLYTK